jgi:hypothetical protein
MAEGQLAVRISRDGRSRLRARRKSSAALGVLTLLLGLAGIVMAGPAQAGQAGSAASKTWKVEATPNPAGAHISDLGSVSCTSAHACTAVGTHTASLSSPIFSVAERWTGTRWKLQHTPTAKGAATSEFYAVSCGSARFCSAVGTAFYTKGSRNLDLVATWTGASWRVHTLSRRGALFAISCTSARACTAVGDTSTASRTLAVAYRWNGKTWRSQVVPRPDNFTWFMGVSCSAARACTAVGYENTGTGDAQPFAEGWNGTKWTVHTVPVPTGAPGGAFRAVSCTSASACTATGASFSADSPTLGERWNGTKWKVQNTPNPPNFETSPEDPTLDGVSCTSTKACTATGEYAPDGVSAYFIEAWNGSSWRLVPAPVPAEFVSGALLGISCVPARCTAVGEWQGGAISQATLAMGN